MTPSVRTRLAVPSDLDPVVALSSALWSDEPAAEIRAHMAATLAGTPRSTLPLVVFVAEREGELVGFVEVGLRSHADGCDGRRPVGYIEGWYVPPQHRRCGVGRALIAAAEQWSQAQGARELASDTWQHQQESIDAHQALGFEPVDRVVNFRKLLGPR